MAVGSAAVSVCLNAPLHLEEAPGAVFPTGNGLRAVGTRVLRSCAGRGWRRWGWGCPCVFFGGRCMYLLCVTWAGGRGW